MAGPVRVQYVNGSAARKLDIPMPRVAPKAPKVKKQKRTVVYVDPVSILGIVIAAVMLVLMSVGCVRLVHARQEVAVMQDYVTTLRRENADLQEQYITGFEPEEVRKTALGLGMIPQEQVRRVSVQVTVPQEAEQSGGWQAFLTFMSGLFA